MLEPAKIIALNKGPMRSVDVCAVEDIFFKTSNVQSFADDAERSAFRERWLGRYLHHDPDLAFAAVDPAGKVLGYLVGATDDPALASRFSDIAFFQAWRHLTAVYPAHLHVNLLAEARGQGIGGRLVEAFIAEAAARCVSGVHVVTGAAARNVGFYYRQGFAEAGRLSQPSGDIVFLGRLL